MLPTLSDSIEADREFLAHLQLARGIVHRRVVERSEHQAFCVVAGGDAHPHPLAHSGNFVGELDLDVIASLVFHATVYRYARSARCHLRRRGGLAPKAKFVATLPTSADQHAL